MTYNPVLELQTALVAALRNHAGLTAALAGQHIYDHVPRRTPFPYVSIANIETRGWDTQTSIGHEHLVTLNAWTSHRGASEVNTILAEISDCLDGQTLSLSGARLINLTVVFWSARRDLEGRAYQGTMRLRAVTEQYP